MIPIESILSRLSKVKRTGGNKWVACCPSHADKSPSLGIKQDGDIILMHCFAGCAIDDICSAIGIEQADLFSDDKQDYAPQTRKHFSAQQIIESMRLEAAMMLIEINDLHKAGKVDDISRKIVSDMALRLNAACDYAEG